MNTELVGINIIQLPETDSTNKALKKLLSQENVLEGTVISTEYQTSGRGQFGNSWESERGQNLLFSTILYPKFLRLSENYRLTMSVCLALIDSLDQLKIKAQIKWPNDLLIGNKKVAGTLLESAINGECFEHCVVGIGLNVNQDSFINSTAVSLRQMAQKNFDHSELSNLLYQNLSKRYLALKNGAATAQQRQFNERLYGQNTRVVITWKDEKHWVFCRGVDPQGNLLVQFEDGSFQLFKHKEISFVLRAD